MLKRVNLIGIEGKMNTFFFTGIHFRIEWNSRGRQFNSVQLHQYLPALTAFGRKCLFCFSRFCATPVPLFLVNTGEIE